MHLSMGSCCFSALLNMVGSSLKPTCTPTITGPCKHSHSMRTIQSDGHTRQSAHHASTGHAGQ
jgi:hypothetical protein